MQEGALEVGKLIAGKQLIEDDEINPFLLVRCILENKINAYEVTGLTFLKRGYKERNLIKWCLTKGLYVWIDDIKSTIEAYLSMIIDKVNSISPDHKNKLPYRKVDLRKSSSEVCRSTGSSVSYHDGNPIFFTIGVNDFSNAIFKNIILEDNKIVDNILYCKISSTSCFDLCILYLSYLFETVEALNQDISFESFNTIMNSEKAAYSYGRDLVMLFIVDQIKRYSFNNNNEIKKMLEAGNKVKEDDIDFQNKENLLEGGKEIERFFTEITGRSASTYYRWRNETITINGEPVKMPIRGAGKRTWTYKDPLEDWLKSKMK